LSGLRETSATPSRHPQGEGKARLITRVRVQYRLFSPATLFNMLIEFFEILMMRKSMLGIKRWAEKSL